MARIATQLMLGKTLAEMDLRRRQVPHYGVKESVFPFPMFPEVDPVLGPEMRSTGEVLGLAESFGMAFYKAQEGAKQLLPTEGTVLISVSRRDRPAVLKAARKFAELGFKILATEGTHAFLAQQGIKAEAIKKLYEGRPNILDAMTNGEIHLVVNTPVGKLSQHDDSYIRKSAIKHKISYITTLPAAEAAAEGIAACRRGGSAVTSLQEYHARLG